MYTVGIHGYDLFPLISLMPFDALTVGNHDLYDDGTIDYMKHGSGFIDGWNGTYLTSNTLNATTMEPVGSRYTVMEGPNSGVRILTFGFLYHQTDSCGSVVVEDPASVVEEDWFKDALRSNGGSVDAIVVLGHMDKDDENVDVILNGIRSMAGEVKGLDTINVQFVTGHTHYRGWTKKDSFSSSFEAGHYLDTLGFMSFDITPDPTWFNFQYVEANLESLCEFTGVEEDEFDTELGTEISKAIEEVRQSEERSDGRAEGWSEATT